MKMRTEILIAEDDDGHATLIERNLRRAGIENTIRRFRDGKEVLDFLFDTGKNKKRRKKPDGSYVLLLDLRMPRIGGIEVLRKVKRDNILDKMPVIVLTTTDNPADVDRCYKLGCSNYVKKPIDYTKFVDAIKLIGHFLLVNEIPQLEKEAPQ